MARTKRGLERSQMLSAKRHGRSVLPAAETTQTLTRWGDSSEDGQELKVPGAIVPPVAEKTGRLTEEFSVPGDLIPDFRGFVTLRERMPTMLSHMTFSMLSDANPAWREALERQLVQNVRASTDSAETLVVMVTKERRREDRKEIRKVIVFSTKDKSWSELPPIPDTKHGFPPCCKCISLHGKIYVLGGDQWEGGMGINDVYMLDLAGQRKWEKCTSMLKPRQQCGVAAMGGKIYVFGGLCNFIPDLGAEVYDPKADAWSSIKPMASSHFAPQVATVGNELVIYSGELLLNPSGVNWRSKFPSFLEIYNPGKDEWKIIDNFGGDKPDGIMIRAKGRYYTIGFDGCHIYFLDFGIYPGRMRQTWRRLQSSSFPGLGLGARVCGHSFLEVGDELLLLVSVVDKGSPGGSGIRLVHSRGFLQGSEELVWQTLNRPGLNSLDFEKCFLLCSAEL